MTTTDHTAALVKKAMKSRSQRRYLAVGFSNRDPESTPHVLRRSDTASKLFGVKPTGWTTLVVDTETGEVVR